VRQAFQGVGRGALAGLALSLAVTVQGAGADVVRMKSGDVVTGRIERADEDDVVIDPDFADTIEIELKYIASIETKNPVKVTFKDGRERTGFIELDAEGRMQVRTEPSRWEKQHPDGQRFLRGVRQPPAGTKEPLPDLRGIQELELAYYRYEANLELGLSAASGNTNSSSLDFGAGVEPSWGPNAMQINAKLTRQTSNDELSAETWNVGLRYVRELPTNWLVSLYGTVESDPFQLLDLRSAVALGPGYRFFDVDPTHLAVGLGVAYVNEDFSVAGADRTFPAVIWTLDFEQEFFGDDVTFYHNHYLIQSFTGSELIFNSTQGLKLDLWGDLDLKFEFDYDHTSEPAPGVTQKDDLRYLVKLDLEFEGDERDWLR
jgi:putative salt-induced outer membrane protein YdiY